MHKKLSAIVRKALDEAAYLLDELMWRMPAVLTVIALSAVTSLATTLIVRAWVAIAARS